MKFGYKKTAKILIIAGILIFIFALIISFVGACRLWKTDKSHTCSMLEFALSRLGAEWKYAFVFGSVPASVGIIMLLTGIKPKQQKNE